MTINQHIFFEKWFEIFKSLLYFFQKYLWVNFYKTKIMNHGNISFNYNRGCMRQNENNLL